MNHFAKDLRIKEVLKEKGVSVILLAEMLSMTRSACYQYINGNPTAERLEQMLDLASKS